MIQEIWIKLDKELLKNGKKCDNVVKYTIKIMKGQKAITKGRNPIEEEQYEFCSKEERMNKLNIDLKQAANYLIQLFYKTGQIYTCTQTKIGKLLSILAFLYARKNELLFNETIYRYDNCGTAITELKTFVNRDVYIQYNYNDDNNYIGEIFDDGVIIPEIHQNIDKLPEEVKIHIENVFRNFGSYSAYELGQLINPIVNYKDITNKDDEIDLLKISTLNYDDFKKEDNFDELIKYLFT